MHAGIIISGVVPISRVQLDRDSCLYLGGGGVYWISKVFIYHSARNICRDTVYNNY